MKIPLVDLAAQTDEIKETLWPVMHAAINDSAFIGGPNLVNFEENFGNFIHSSNFVGVSNGTSALEISLLAAGIKQGDEVITVAHTFFATVEAILNVGAVPIFVDVHLESGLIDIESIEDRISTRTRAVVPVHIYGHMAHLDNLKVICEKYGLKLIEDAAQAHGAKDINGNFAGTIGDFGTFSFFPGKNLGAWGDAGGIVTRTASDLEIVRKLKDHGRLSKYEHDLVGTNARMDALQSIVLNEKLKHLPRWNTRRQEIAQHYIEILNTHGHKVVAPKDSSGSAWHLFVVRVRNRSEFQEMFTKLGIATGIHYPIPLHKQPALAARYENVILGNTETLAEEIVSIPIHPHLTDMEVEYISKQFVKVAKFVE
jgi:dTDP-4-amino-4,6-dideoxygalactose transaminase